MTTLMLAFQGQIGRVALVAGTVNHLSLFPRETVSYFLTLVLAAIVAMYLFGVYALFRLGFEFDQAVSVREELRENVLKQEILLQKKIDRLAVQEPSIVEKMERVSHIKYLEQNGVASSRSYISP